MNDHELWSALESWSKDNNADLARDENTYKLSWPVDDPIGYIDVSPDPKREIVVVQHGTIDQQTQAGTPCGSTRWRYQDLSKHLSELKYQVETTKVPAPTRTWKYTPRIDIGTIKGFKFR
jgi:hypothetical protein